MHYTSAISLLALGGLAQASTTLRVFLDGSGMMGNDIEVETAAEKVLNYAVFRADMIKTSDSSVRCQVLDESGTVAVVTVCESEVFSEGVNNATIRCDSAPTETFKPSTFVTFVVPTTTAANPAVQTAVVEIDNDGVDSAQQINVPVNGAPVAFKGLVTDITLNSVTGNSAGVKCQAWSDAGATAPLGGTTELKKEADTRAAGQPVNVQAITCFTS